MKHRADARTPELDLACAPVFDLNPDDYADPWPMPTPRKWVPRPERDDFWFLCVMAVGLSVLAWAAA